MRFALNATGSRRLKEELEQEKSRLDGMRRQILNNEAELEPNRGFP